MGSKRFPLWVAMNNSRKNVTKSAGKPSLVVLCQNADGRVSGELVENSVILFWKQLLLTGAFTSLKKSIFEYDYESRMRISCLKVMRGEKKKTPGDTLRPAVGTRKPNSQRRNSVQEPPSMMQQESDVTKWRLNQLPADPSSR
jgi:hypothetical protein